VLLSACLLVDARQADPPAAGADPDAARSTIGKWIATQQIILKETKEWQQGKEILQSRIELLDQEIASLEEKLAKAREGTAEADRKEGELAGEQRGARLAAEVTDLEGAIKTVHASLPPPVQERLAPLFQRIPADPAATKASVGERYQNVLGMLNEINKSNGEIMLVNEIRALSDGKPSEVKSIYVGLGQAYYLSASGEAGVGRPAAAGWEWIPANELAPNIQEVVDILQNKGSPKFVPLPVEIR
jgi:hypothetical protein